MPPADVVPAAPARPAELSSLLRRGGRLRDAGHRGDAPPTNHATATAPDRGNASSSCRSRRADHGVLMVHRSRSPSPRNVRQGRRAAADGRQRQIRRHRSGPAPPAASGDRFRRRAGRCATAAPDAPVKAGSTVSSPSAVAASTRSVPAIAMLEVGRPGVAASIRRRRDRPFLLGLQHVRRHPHADGAGRPAARRPAPAPATGSAAAVEPSAAPGPPGPRGRGPPTGTPGTAISRTVPVRADSIW